MAKKVEYIIDIRTISESNTRGHWAKNLTLHQEQTYLGELMTRRALEALPADHDLRKVDAPIDILMVRHACTEMDSDNLPVAMKYVRDGIANALEPGMRPGRADGLSRFSWTYRQRKIRKRQSSIHVILSKYVRPDQKHDPHNGRLFLPGTKTFQGPGPWDGNNQN